MSTNNDSNNPNETATTWDAAFPALIEMANSQDRKDAIAAYTELRRAALLADRTAEFVPALNLCLAVLEDVGSECSIGEDCDIPHKLGEKIDLAIKVATQALGGGSPATIIKSSDEPSRIITLN